MQNRNVINDTFEIKNPEFPNFAVTHIGGREENQDNCTIVNTEHGLLAIVCDGMGGMNGGATASRVATEEIVNRVRKPISQNDIPVTNRMLLLDAICSANARLRSMAAEDLSLRGMGTTVAAVLINETSACVAYVGDSRVYQVRDKRKVFRTFDHSMVFEMVKRKVIKEEQARLSAQSNIILRALGLKDDVEIDSYELPYDKGDVFFLCSDGIWGALPEKELIKHISVKKHPEVVTKAIANLVNGIGIRNGSRHDNLTAVMFTTTKNSKLRNKMERTLKILLAVFLGLFLASFLANFIPRNSQPEKSIAISENGTVKQYIFQKELTDTVRNDRDSITITQSYTYKHIDESVTK